VLARLGTSLNSSNSSGARVLIDVWCREIDGGLCDLSVVVQNADPWHLPVRMRARWFEYVCCLRPLSFKDS
jgi:hypothetical protein